jgi:hypothetical protein
MNISKEVIRQILSGRFTDLIKDGRLCYDSILLGQDGGRMKIEFLKGDTTVFTMYNHLPHFRAGETLTLSGLEGSVDLELVS